MASPPGRCQVRSALTELTLARVRELTREPEAVFWVFVFPILLAGILSLAFRSRPPDPSARRHRGRPAGNRRMSALSSESGASPASALPGGGQPGAGSRPSGRRHRCGRDAELRVRPDAADSRTALLLVDAALQRAAGRVDAFAATRAEVTEPGARYVDFLVPGLLGMNLMGTGMWGIGFSLVVGPQRQPAQAADCRAGAPESLPGGAAHLAPAVPGSRSRRAPALRPLRARRADARLADRC